MDRLSRSAAVFLGVICAAHFCHGSYLFAESFDSDPEIARFASIESPVPPESMAEIALAFSGVASADRAHYVEAIRRLAYSIAGELPHGLDDYAKGEALLAALHDKVLGSYVVSQTRLDVLLDTGRYNCVSSAVLYFIVARAFGLDPTAITTPDHVFCTVRIGDRTIDVETTTRFGFDPGRRKEFFDAFGNLTGFSYVPPSNHRSRETGQDRDLLSLILHNRISELDSRGAFNEAFSLALDRFVFLGTAAAFEDVVREAGNRVAVMNSGGRYDAALEFLDGLRTSFPGVESFSSLYGGVLHNRVVEYLGDSDFDAAAHAVMLGAAVIDRAKRIELDTMIVRRRLAAHLPALSPEAGMAYLDRMIAETVVPEESVREFRLSLYIRSAEETVAHSGYLAAAEVIEAAISMFGGDARLERARSVYRYNFAAESHNRFAELFNDGKFEEAFVIVTEALRFVPESPLLARDLKTVGRVMESAVSDRR